MGRHSDGMGGHCGVVAYDGGSDPLHRSASGSYPSSPAWGMESCSRQSFAVHNVAACTHRGRNLFIEINGMFLAVQNSSISDIVCPLVGPSV